MSTPPQIWGTDHLRQLVVTSIPQTTSPKSSCTAIESRIPTSGRVVARLQAAKFFEPSNGDKLTAIPRTPGPADLTNDQLRPSLEGRTSSALISMEAGPGERRGGEAGGFLARLQQRVRRTRWLRDYAGRAVVSHVNEARARSLPSASCAVRLGL